MKNSCLVIQCHPLSPSVAQCHPVLPSIARLPDTKWHFQATFKLFPLCHKGLTYLFSLVTRCHPVSPCVTRVTQFGPVLPSVAQCHPVLPCVTFVTHCGPALPALLTLSSCRGVIDEMHICKPEISKQDENFQFFSDFIIKIRSDLWLIDSFT